MKRELMDLPNDDGTLHRPQARKLTSYNCCTIKLNSMRQEHSKWKLMMRAHRAPCVINQHTARDVSSWRFHLISWTEWGTNFKLAVFLERKGSRCRFSQCTERDTSNFFRRYDSKAIKECYSSDENFENVIYTGTHLHQL